METTQIFLTVVLWIVIIFVGIVSFVFLLRASISKIFKITNDKQLNDCTLYMILFIICTITVVCCLSVLIYFSFTFYTNPPDSNNFGKINIIKSLVFVLFSIIAFPIILIITMKFVIKLAKFNKEKRLNDFWFSMSVFTVFTVAFLIIIGSGFLLYICTEMSINEFLEGIFLSLSIILIIFSCWWINAIKNVCSSVYPFQLSTYHSLLE